MERIIKYVITDGEKYVVDSNATSLTTDKSKAFVWSTDQAEVTVLSSALSRKNEVSRLSKEFKVRTVEYYVADRSEDVEYDLNIIRQFIDTVKYYRENKTAITQLLSRYHSKMQDIEHYIEFTDLNARDGYKAYNALRKTRRARREYKNKAAIATALTNIDINIESLEGLLKNFYGTTYIPKQVTIDEFLDG